MRKKMIPAAGAVLALTLAAHVQPAAAQADALKAAGKSFADALARDAAACKSKLNALNVTAVKNTTACLLAAVKAAAKNAILDLVRGLFDEMITLLRTNAPRAKQKLAELGEKVTAVLPAARSVVGPVVAGVSAGGDKLAEEAAKCKEKITALDMTAVRATFSCLATALKVSVKAAGIAIVQGLFDEFIGLLNRGCDLAVGKLGELAARAVRLIPAARGVLDKAISAIRSGCSGAVDKVATLR
jgi:ElaB/YqjD/DUF883 family membrane-anchored ribosome-binding protein